MIDRALREAARRREGLGLEAYRLAHEGELPVRATVDAYGGFAVLAVLDDEAIAQERALGEALLGLGFRGVHLKRRPKVASRASADPDRVAPRAPLVGEAAPDPSIVTENGVRLRVRLAHGLSTGLFLDHRENRARVAEISSGARVLNLFAYTCAFSVAAALGGAARVTSVDVSADALSWGEENFRENGLDPAAHRFKKEDARTALARAAVRGDRWDVVILDPPSFASKRDAEHDIAKDLGPLLEAVARVLAPGGVALVSTNHRKTPLRALRGAVRAAFPSASVESPPLPPDFPMTEGDEPFVKTVIARRS